MLTWRAYYYTRNRLLFFARHAKGSQRAWIFFQIFAHLGRHFFALPMRGERGKRQWKAERYGVKDFFAGKFGKADCLDW